MLTESSGTACVCSAGGQQIVRHDRASCATMPVCIAINKLFSELQYQLQGILP